MSLYTTVITAIFNIASAIVVLLLGFIIAQIGERVILKVLAELESNLHMERIGIRLAVDSIVSNAVSLFIYVYTVYLALRQLELINAVFYFLLAVFSLLIALSFFMGVRDFFPNLFAGLTLRIQKGKKIQHNNTLLVVEKVQLLETRLTNNNKEVFYIPNAQMKYFL